MSELFKIIFFSSAEMLRYDYTARCTYLYTLFYNDKNNNNRMDVIYFRFSINVNVRIMAVACAQLI